MKKITSERIAELAGAKGCKKIAVENFLMSMGENAQEALANLEYDARIYKWNEATKKAIQKGIREACSA